MSANEPEPGEEPPLGCFTKIKLFIANHWRGVTTLVVPLLALGVCAPFPAEKYQWCAYCLVVMAVFWVTECIALPVTAFLPVVVFPLTGIMDTSTICKCYINDTIVMFLGSLVLAAAVEQSGLHIRLALCAIRAIGYSHYKLLFAISYVTMFVSMWITNTAATTMMVPMIFAILKVFEDTNLLTLYDTTPDGEKSATDMTSCYFCAATYSATIGGIGTLVGTGTNLVFKGLYQETFPDEPEHLSFPLFSAFAVPYMLAMETAMYLCLILVYLGFLRPGSATAKRATVPPEGIEAAKHAVQEQWDNLGRISFWEVMVIFLFCGAMVAFFCRSPQIFPGWGDLMIESFGLKDYKFIRDSACAFFVATLMFLLPSNLSIFKNCSVKYREELPKNPVRSVLDWNVMDAAMPWSFTFLLGGGFALSNAAKKDYSNLNGKIGEFLSQLKDLPNLAIIFIIIVFTVFVTNFASNVAVCTVVSPIVMQLATQINQNPLWYNIAAGYSASYCFCLPVGTPGNLIVQSAAKIPTKKMITAGAGPTVTTIILTWLFISFYAPVIWPSLHTHDSQGNNATTNGAALRYY